MEYLALAYLRGNHDAVVELAPILVERVAIPRKQIKAQLILASVLLSLDHSMEAKEPLEGARQDPAIENEPTLRAWLLTKLGTAFSGLGRTSEAMANFGAAGAILAKYQHPMQLGDLYSSIGEHLAKLGQLEEAALHSGLSRERGRRR